MLIILVPSCILIGHLQDKYYKDQLVNQGVIVYGKVMELFTKKHKNGKTDYAKFRYQLNDKMWIQEVVNYDHQFELFDSLQILCSNEEPEIFEIKGYIRKKSTTR